MRPIFIFGCERSGTTLLGSLLGSHSHCVATPEAPFVAEVYRQHLARDAGFDLNHTLGKIKNDFRFKLWNIDVSAQAAERAGVSSYKTLIDYLLATYSAGLGKNANVWIDHTPTNVRVAATLSELFPEAKFIHLVRDGRAVVSSIKSLDWGVHATRQLSQQWIMKVGCGLAAESYLGPERSLRVSYEALTGSTEQTLRTICTFAGLSYEAEMVAGTGFAVPQYTEKQHGLVGKPPDPARADAWKKRLSPQDIQTFEHSSRDMLIYLGYKPLYGTKAKPEENSERYRALLADALWYRWRDAYKTRQKQKRALEGLRIQGYLNRK